MYENCLKQRSIKNWATTIDKSELHFYEPPDFTSPKRGTPEGVIQQFQI